MRVPALVLLMCIVLGGCGWTNKRGRGTNYDPDAQTLPGDDYRRRL